MWITIFYILVTIVDKGSVHMAKQRIDVVASEEAFKNLASFNDIEDMNKAVRTYKDMIAATIKRVDARMNLTKLLEVLKRHSCKYVGVSFLCKNSLAAKMEVSYKTIQRLTKRLEDLNIIKQIPMKRKSDMNQTSNAVVILPVENDMSEKHPQEKSEKCPTVNTKPVSLKQNIKDINKRNTYQDITVSKDNITEADFVAHWVPKRFSSFLSSFYRKSETIQEFWKVVRQCNKPDGTGKYAFTKEQETVIGIQAAKELVMKIKKGVKMKKGTFAYFNGIVANIMDELYFNNEFMGEL
ncbi:putative cytosolic protein [Bacillus phage vB_BspM_MarvelLand]|nr:putative cytosolic protein [Bacillus phage vB_BspM_MarvelLand]